MISSDMKYNMIKVWNAIKFKWRKALTTLTSSSISAISWTISIQLRLFLEHFGVRPRATIIIKTSKSNSHIARIKKLKYWGAFWLPRSEVAFRPVRGIYIISQSTELLLTWLLHWKTSSTTFMFCTSASLTSIIKKFAT